MIHVRQRIPDFVDAKWWEEPTVETLNDLLALPWVERWRETPGFIRFSISKRPTDYLLMAEFTDSFWVVAFLDRPVDLPEWVEPKKAE